MRASATVAMLDKQLARQAELAYRRLVTDWQATASRLQRRRRRVSCVLCAVIVQGESGDRGAGDGLASATV